jgi:hypothetical protein
MRFVAAATVVLVVLTVACARRHAASPEEAMRNNDIDWTVHRTPEPPREESPR